jgi:hypothetical protein
MTALLYRSGDILSACLNLAFALALLNRRSAYAVRLSLHPAAVSLRIFELHSNIYHIFTFFKNRKGLEVGALT